MDDLDNPPDFKERILGIFQHGLLFLWAIKYYAIVVLETIFKRGQIFAPLFQSQQVRDEAFGRFWVQFSVARDEKGVAVLDKGVPDPETLRDSSKLIPDLLKQLRGVVLDVGPGSGSQIPYFAVQETSEKISTVYGAEPCTGLHAELRQRVIANGLESKYHILSAGAEKQGLLEALRREGVVTQDNKNKGEAGIFDTIVCIRVLCSVPNPRQTIADLYSLLKPGGQILVLEHVVNPFSFSSHSRHDQGGDLLARVMQSVYTLMGWRFFVGNCDLLRDTKSYLREAAEQDGGWKSFDLKSRFTWSTLPYISGVAVKKD